MPIDDILDLPTGNATDAARLAGRVVLITGAGNGIGRALATASAARGASVVLLDRQVPALEAVYDEIEAAGHPQPAIYPMDLAGATPDDIATLGERIGDSLGRLDALVHNAAELGKPAPLAHYGIQAWMRTLHVDLNAPFLLTRYLLPLLQASDSGRIVFVSDRAGRTGQAYMGAYGVAKWGLEGLMRTLAAELPDHSALRVTSVDPGPTHTMLRRQGWPGEPSQHLPLPDAFADHLLYLIDPAQNPVQGGCYRRAGE